MNTAIGEVKTIRDLFRNFKETAHEPGSGGFGSVIEEKAMCKLCGEIVVGVSTKGACRSGMFFIKQAMEEHLDLHKMVRDLGINLDR